LLGSDLASSGGLGSGDQFNGGAVKSYGIEIATNYRTKLTSKIWLPWQIQYTYNKATFSNSFESDFEPWSAVRSGDNLPYLAPHTFTISTGLRCQNWSWNIVGSYMDDMRIKAGQGKLNTDEEIAGRFLVSSNIMIGIDKKVNLTLGVHNLLNNRYAVATRPAGWRPGAPRNITAGLQVRF
jgi:Fe(3+) dicitrate transport protein